MGRLTRESAAASPLGEPLLTAGDVAAFLGVHIASVYRLAGRADGLPVVEIGPGVRRFRPQDVRDLVERRTRAAQVRSTRAEQLLGPAGGAPRNRLATCRGKSGSAKQEPSAGSKRTEPEAQE